MSTIVFLGPPAHGHVNPTLPVARELIQRGEQVVYFNHEEFRSRIEATDATFHPYPEGAIRASDFANRLQQGGLATVGLLILRATERLLPYLLEQIPTHRPDLVIYDSIALWGKMAATRLGVRSVSSITHFVYDTSHLMGEGDTSSIGVGTATIRVALSGLFSQSASPSASAWGFEPRFYRA
jgi:MGT family glycosyltransferase